MQRQYRLGPNRQFNYVYRRGKRVSCREMSLLYVKSGQKKVGFSVNKKVGNAVVRNHTKRQLRECIRPRLADMQKGLYVFVARPEAAQCSFHALDRCVAKLMQRAGVYPLQQADKMHK